jgi:hypothetical protein
MKEPTTMSTSTESNRILTAARSAIKSASEPPPKSVRGLENIGLVVSARKVRADRRFCLKIEALTAALGFFEKNAARCREIRSGYVPAALDTAFTMLAAREERRNLESQKLELRKDRARYAALCRKVKNCPPEEAEALECEKQNAKSALDTRRANLDECFFHNNERLLDADFWLAQECLDRAGSKTFEELVGAAGELTGLAAKAEELLANITTLTMSIDGQLGKQAT